MAHEIKRLSYGRRAAYARAVEEAAKARSVKKSVYEIMPLAEKAFTIAKGRDKEGAFLATVISAVPKKRQGAFVSYISQYGNLPQRMAAEVRTLENLDDMEIADKMRLSVYEQKIMNNEISVATLIARIVRLAAGEEVDFTRLLYVYSPLGACIDYDMGSALRERAIKEMYPDKLEEIRHLFAERQQTIMKAKERLDALTCRAADRGGNCRIKNIFSATFKLAEKGHLNDLLGSRIVVEDVKKAISVAERIVTFLKQHCTEVEVNDYYKKPKQTTYMGYNINFSLAGVPSEIQVSDIATRLRIKRQAPHALYKSYGVLGMNLTTKLQNYL